MRPVYKVILGTFALVKSRMNEFSWLLKIAGHSIVLDVAIQKGAGETERIVAVFPHLSVSVNNPQWRIVLKNLD